MEIDLGRRVITVFSVGGYEIAFTETMRNTALVSAALVILAVCAAFRLKLRDEPSGLQSALEAGVEMFSRMVGDAVGDGSGFFGSWFFAVFLFILFSNYSGLLGLRPPTASFSVTFSLALATFAQIHITGIVRQKGGYFKGYFEPFPLFFPLNAISAISTPVSLSFRLFGNILGGTIIMTMMYSALPWFFRWLAPVPFHLYFDVFSGAVQAVIFTMLSLMFIGERV